ncbi:MAG: efflux RND transporter permease subunit, partial [Bacteroidota bacterium]
GVAIKGDLDLRTLKHYAREVEDDLREVKGISKIDLSGFPDEEIEIAFREQDLQNYDLTFQEATLAVRNANIEVTGGTVKGETEELIVRSNQKGYFAKDLVNIPLKTADNGVIIRLEDVADVRDKWADDPDRAYINSDPAVIINIQNTADEDILFITEYVNNYVEEFNASHDGVEVIVTRDGSVSLRERIDLLVENGVLGFFLVLILLAMFLNYRMAFWVALAIPVSFAGMFMIVPFTGLTINVVSLFAMILVIGILVDDGIVISENIYRHFEMGKSRKQAAIDGTMEVLPAVFSAILTTVIAFSTFIFLDGQLGDFFTEMSWVVIFTLIFSLVEGAFILPEHIGHSKALSFKRVDPNTKGFDDSDYAEPNLADRIFGSISRAFDRVMIFMRDRLYGPALKFSMRNKFFALTVAFGLMFISFAMVGGGLVKGTFFPNIDGDDIAVNLKLESGTREQYVEDWLAHIEAAAWRVNEKLKSERPDGKDVIEKIQRTIGPTTYQGSMSITLLSGEEREMLSLYIGNMIRDEAGPIIGAESITFGSFSAFGKPIEISVRGEDYSELKPAVEELKDSMFQIAELKDVADDNQEGLKEIDVRLKDKALVLGLTAQDILSQVRSGFFGSEVQRLQRGEDEVKVWVRYADRDRSSVGKLENMRIRVNGSEYPLDELAAFKIARGVTTINRVDGNREIKLSADISDPNASVTDLTALLENEIAPKIAQRYPSVEFAFVGQNEEQQDTITSMGRVGPIILFLMFCVIALTFRSLSQTFVVAAIVPFSLIGVIWGHYAIGLPISMFSVLGLIALIGVLVNDALVFVTAYNIRIKDGMEQMEAMYETGLSRFRPILLTSVTTIAGLGPLILNKSFQAQFLIPMAISIAFGLLVVTFIILIILPVLLIIVNRYKVYTIWMWEGVKPSFNSVEPATLNGRKRAAILWVGTFAIVSLGLYTLMSVVQSLT